MDNRNYKSLHEKIINKNNFHCGHIISKNNGGIIHEVNLYAKKGQICHK